MLAFDYLYSVREIVYISVLVSVPFASVIDTHLAYPIRLNVVTVE